MLFTIDRPQPVVKGISESHIWLSRIFDYGHFRGELLTRHFPSRRTNREFHRAYSCRIDNANAR